MTDFETIGSQWNHNNKHYHMSRLQRIQDWPEP